MWRRASTTVRLALASSLLTLRFPLFPVHPLFRLQNTTDANFKYHWWLERVGHTFLYFAKKVKYLRGYHFWSFRSAASRHVLDAWDLFTSGYMIGVRPSRIIAPPTGLEFSVLHLGQQTTDSMLTGQVLVTHRPCLDALDRRVPGSCCQYPATSHSH